MKLTIPHFRPNTHPSISVQPSHLFRVFTGNTGQITLVIFSISDFEMFILSDVSKSLLVMQSIDNDQATREVSPAIFMHVQRKSPLRFVKREPLDK